MKKYQSMDRVTVLGLVCEKMTEWVVLPRQEGEDRPSRKKVVRIVEDDPGEEEDIEDDEGVQDQRQIWEVAHVSEEELETTEGEGVDLLTQFLEMVGWSEVNDNESEKDLPSLLSWLLFDRTRSVFFNKHCWTLRPRVHAQVT